MRRFKNPVMFGLVRTHGIEDTDTGLPFVQRREKSLCTSNVQANNLICYYVERYDPFQLHSRVPLDSVQRAIEILEVLEAPMRHHQNKLASQRLTAVA